jgi:hypothetical protein
MRSSPRWTGRTKKGNVKQAANCKFCGKPMVLTIDDDYGKLGDPFKLLKMAACNRCSDLRTKRTRLEDQIRKICLSMVASRPGQDEAARIMVGLDKLTQRYALLVADWHNMSGSAWDQTFSQMLMDRPDAFSIILSQYWKMFRQTQVKPEQKEMVTA